ncbi:MAG: hypothetical protein LW645_01180 [Verrucomicrobiaceae bacterium]|nr:hypothetical protein [Verrucomicrobiaceae bacterium]
MSEPENTPTPPPATTPKTAAVPLKKETVRITLRGRPGVGVTQPREATAPVAPSAGSFPASPKTTSVVPTMAKKATAPIQLPSAPLPPPAPRRSTSPVKLPAPPLSPPSKKTTSAIPVSASPPPAAPPPSSPMPPPGRPLAPSAPPIAKPPGVPTAPRPAAPPMAGLPAATRPLAQNPAAPPAPRVEAGAPTVPLQKGPPRPPGSGTGPMTGSAAPLPKATVKLAPTQVMQRPSISAPPSAPVKRSAAADAEQFYEEKDPEAGLVPLSVICFVLSAILMAVQMFGADAVKDDPTGESPIMVPSAAAQSWESRSIITGVWTNKFKDTLLPIP